MVKKVKLVVVNGVVQDTSKRQINSLPSPIQPTIAFGAVAYDGSSGQFSGYSRSVMRHGNRRY